MSTSMEESNLPVKPADPLPHEHPAAPPPKPSPKNKMVLPAIIGVVLCGFICLGLFCLGFGLVVYERNNGFPASPIKIPWPPIGNTTPVLGHYEGTDPGVSFDVTAAGIENFSITVPFSNGTCTFAPTNPLIIESNGSFSFETALGENSSDPDIYFSGKIKGSTVSGTYSVRICVGGGQLSIQSEPSKGEWSATLQQ